MNERISTEHKQNTYFISDLHLHPSHPLLFTLFYDFIDDIQNSADALYILGDLFEFWIGDDIIDKPVGKPYQQVVEKLKSLSDSGTRLYFMQGNRDFLAKDKFVASIGAELLADQKTIDLYGTPALIMHGDTLCTDDKSYQRMRYFFRLSLVQKLYLLQSATRRQKIADKARNITQNETRKKSSVILDVNQEQVEKVVKTRGVGLLIHGHTHRPAIHQFMLNDKPIKRIVLSDWQDKASFLCISPTSQSLQY